MWRARDVWVGHGAPDWFTGHLYGANGCADRLPKHNQIEVQMQARGLFAKHLRSAPCRPIVSSSPADL